MNGGNRLKAVITVIGKDRVGIVSQVSQKIAECQLNILDINQTLMEQYFTMIMLVNLEQSKYDIATLSEIFSELGTKMGLSIRIQHKNLFDSMYHV